VQKDLKGEMIKRVRDEIRANPQFLLDFHPFAV